MCLLGYSWKHVWKKTMGFVCLLFGRIFQCFVSFPQAAVHGAPWEDHQKALRKPSEMVDQTWRGNLQQIFPPQRHHFKESHVWREKITEIHASTCILSWILQKLQLKVEAKLPLHLQQNTLRHQHSHSYRRREKVSVAQQEGTQMDNTFVFCEDEYEKIKSLTGRAQREARELQKLLLQAQM
ncbi:uncharacterized protein LOC119705668 isoform X2 [Motacilla alba alba]|uniref:uncharacterized protein LOC119705668 isoform X2 n=1 Tax=Motacilla alba alba TaxID=1094192 RepID=UPI0018D58B06|nr:uncharacterized protein LOC119705668 isoform X2 [Motacilla alba alba]